VSGDFELAVIDQGHGDLVLSARFFDAANKAYGIERLSATNARVALPAQTRMVIDVQGGLPPRACRSALPRRKADACSMST